MLRFIPAIAWLIIITYLFLLPGSALPNETWFEKVYLDKWVHAGFFFLLVYLFYIPLRNKTGKRLITLAVLGLTYGLVIELIQRFCTADRSFDIMDIIFDGIGCTAAYIAGKRQLKK